MKRATRYIGILVFVVLALLFLVSPERKTEASVYKAFNYQGKLLDNAGVAVANGNYSIYFLIYDDLAAGSCLWSARGTCGAPTAKTIAVSGGIFSTMLGEAGDTALPDFTSDTYYLEVRIDYSGTPQTLTPRKRIGSVPQALNANALVGDGVINLTSGATTTNAAAITVNSLTTGNGLSISSTSLTSGALINLSENGTAALTNQKGLNISLAGTNGTAAQTTYGASISNTHAGTTSTNVGLYVTASNGTTANYAAIFDAGNVGIGTTVPLAKLAINGGLHVGGDSDPGDNNLLVDGTISGASVTATGKISSGGYLNLTNDNLLSNGDFETGTADGWTGTTAIVAGGYSGNYAAEFTGSRTFYSDDYIPVDPVYDVLQLEAYVQKTVAGTTPGSLYFGYFAFDASKVLITTAPCGTYCYFAASGKVFPVDSTWHKVSATTTGEGTSFPNFPVGTRYIKVLGLMNQTGSSDTVSQIDHIVLKRIYNAPLFVGNNFSATNLTDQFQVSKIYTTSTNGLNFSSPSDGDYLFNGLGNVGINTASPSHKLQITDANTTASRAGLYVSQTGAITGTGYAGYFSKTGASTVNTGLYTSASGATTNYGIYVAAGTGYFAADIQLAQISAPSPTADKLYNVSGNLVWNGINLSAGGALPSGTTGQTLRNNGTSWTANSVLTNDGTSVAVTSTNATGTTTSSALALSANSLTSGTGLYVASSTLSSGSLVDLAVTGTAAASNTQKVLNISTSGANAGATQTTYGSYISNTHTGTTSTNVGLYSTASGATNNYAAIFDAGNVGVGTTTPTYQLETTKTVKAGTALYANSRQLDFDGINDYVSLGNITEMSTSVATLTVSGWFRQDVLSATDNMIFRSIDATNGYIWQTTASQLGIYVRNGANSYALLNTYTNYVQAGRWHHIAVVYDGGGATNADKLKLYIDGVYIPFTSFVSTIPTTLADLSSVNAYIGYSSSAYDGGMQDVRMYTDAVSAANVAIIYQGGTYTTNMVHQYKLMEGTGLVATDTGSNVMNGTISGATWSTTNNVGIQTDFGRGALTLAPSTTNAKDGLWFGYDVNLYRSAAGVLKTDGAFSLAQISAPSPTTDKLYNVSGNLVWNGINLSAGGALPAGTTGQTLRHDGASWVASSVLTNDATRVGVTSTNATGTTTASALALSANSLTTGTGLYAASSTLSSGSLVDLAVSGTAGLTGQKGLNISLAGTNGTAAQTTYGGYISNTHAGTTSTNVGLYVSASGGTTANHGLLVASGDVGIGTTAPRQKLNVYDGNFELVNTATTSSEKVLNGDYSTWTAALPDDWLKGASVTIAKETVDTHGAPNAAKVTGAGSIAGSANYWFQQNLVFPDSYPDMMYKVTFWVKSITGSGSFYGGNGYTVGKTVTAAEAGSWTQFSYYVTGSVTSTYRYLTFGSTAATDWLLDDVSVTEIIGGNAIVHGVITGGGTSGLKVGSNGYAGIGTTAPVEGLSLATTYKIGWEASAGVVDTNLYRSAADTLKTDDSLVVTGSLGITGTRVSKGWFTDLQTTNAPIIDSLTATRLVYAGASKELVSSANMTYDATNGLSLAAGSTAALTLSSTAGTAAGGIIWGTDTNLYRVAANQLKTDDSLGIGITPTSYLTLKAGTATPSTAPLKFTTGTDLTAPEAGAFEYDGTNLHFTNSGALRRNLTTEQYVQSRSLNLITNGSGLMLDNTNFSTFTYDQVETHGGAGSFRTNVQQTSKSSDELIPVNPTKTYKLDIWGKSGDTGGGNYNAANRQYIGIMELDIAGNSIQPPNSAKYAGSTDTTLAADLNVGDNTVTLTDATGWYNSTTATSREFAWWPYTNAYGYVWANYTYTRNLSRDYSSSAIYGTWTVPTTSIASPVWAAADKSLSRGSGSFLVDGVMAGDTLTSTNASNPGTLTVATVAATKLTFVEAVIDSTAATVVTYVGEGITGNVIKLRVPWAGPAITSGQAVRNSPEGGTYKYTNAVNVIMPNAWTQYTGYLNKPSGNGLYSTSEFSVGTANIKLLFLVNYHGAADNNVRYSDLSLSEVDTVSNTLMSAPTGNEVGYTFNYTTNKATSGNDTGLVINQTDTASPGTSLLFDAQVASSSKFNVTNTGNVNVVSANATGATTSSALSLSVNSLTTGTGLYLASSSLSSGAMIDVAVTGTAGLTNQKGINVSLSGTNGTSAQTTYGTYISNTHAGTTSTNYGLYTTVGGGTTANYSIGTGALTAVVSATNAQINLGTISGTANSSTNYGINIGAITSAGTSTTNYGLYVGAVSGATNNYAAIFAGGNVGIGTASPTAPLQIASTTSEYLKMAGTNTVDLDATTYFYALDATQTYNGGLTGSNASTFYGMYFNPTLSGTINSSGAFNVRGLVGNPAISGTITTVNAASNARGVLASINFSGSGTYPTVQGLYATVSSTGATSVITNGYSIYVPNATASGGGVITNNYGLYIASQTAGGTLNYSIYSAGGQNYFGGNVGIGTTAPTNALSLSGQAAQKIWMERHTTSNTAGNGLSVQAGSATLSATDKNGGDLTLMPGIATGNGSASIILQAITGSQGAGTTDRNPATVLTIAGASANLAAGKALTFAGSSSGVITIQPAAAAGTYSLTLPTDDGTPNQYLKTDGSGVLSWNSIALAGADTQLLFNDGGSAMGGDSGLTYNKTTDVLTIVGGLITAYVKPASDSTTAFQIQKSGGTNVLNVDTTNGRVGIGNAAPGAVLNLTAASLGDEVFKIETTSTNDDPNYRIFQHRTTTTNATPATLYSVDLSGAPWPGNAVLFEARVVARETGGAPGTGASYIRKASFLYTILGGLVQLGTTTSDFTGESAGSAAWDCTIDTSGTTIRVTVTGAAATNITWHDTVIIQNVQQ